MLMRLPVAHGTSERHHQDRTEGVVRRGKPWGRYRDTATGKASERELRGTLRRLRGSIAGLSPGRGWQRTQNAPCAFVTMRFLPEKGRKPSGVFASGLPIGDSSVKSGAGIRLIFRCLLSVKVSRPAKTIDHAALPPVLTLLYSQASSSRPASRRLRAWSAAVLARRASAVVRQPVPV